jgi:hypothetical protein
LIMAHKITQKSFDELVGVLQLRSIKGKYPTTWGVKTREGLKATVENIIVEES